MAQKIDRGNRRKRPIYVWFLLAGAITISGMFAGGLAKYTHQESKEEKGNSQQFYFTSDYLTEEGASYTLSADTKDLRIELRNYEDALRWSDSDISYKYTVTKDGNNDADTADVASGSGTITKKDSSGNTDTISITNMSAGTYQVTAEATEPYTKTLKGSFTIPTENSEIAYTVSDTANSPYVLLTVSTDAYNGNVKISWPEGLIPDSTQDVFQNVTTWSESGKSYSAKQIEVSVSKNSSYTYRFFKTDTTNDYTEKDITAVKVQ